eukprot:scaffold726_cov262-Pinguiococcus_pyrenoidosus.AAC.8
MPDTTRHGSGKGALHLNELLSYPPRENAAADPAACKPGSVECRAGTSSTASCPSLPQKAA